MAVRAPEIFELLLDRGAGLQLHGGEREPILSQALLTSSVATVEIIQRRMLSNINAHRTLLAKAAGGGEPMVKYLLDQGYLADAVNGEVKAALLWAMSQANTAVMTLLCENRSMSNLFTIEQPNLLKSVTSETGNVKAVAATIHILLAHGIEMEAGRSPLFGFLQWENAGISPGHVDFYFPLLLGRGADPLQGDGHHTPLSYAARKGFESIVRDFLKYLDRRSIPLEELQQKLAHAEYEAKKKGYVDILSLLHRAYWRKKYQGLPVHPSSPPGQ